MAAAVTGLDERPSLCDLQPRPGIDVGVPGGGALPNCGRVRRTMVSMEST